VPTVWWAPGLTSAERDRTPCTETGDLAQWAGEVDRLLATSPARAADGLAWRDAFGVLMEPFLRDVRLPAALVDGLRRALVRTALRVLVLELNVAAVTGRAGSVTEFVDGLDLAALFAEYPVLARLLWQRTTATVTAFDELMRRFEQDRADIGRVLFGGVDPGPVTEVEAGLGDTHAGRSVAVLRCANGGTIVYRPRPPAVHVQFNRVVEWFGRIEPSLAPRAVRVLDRGGWGWAEFVVARPASNGAALRRYFRRYGALAALLHVLDGTDQHYENVVACDDHPVLVDLETLFHPPRAAVADPAATALAASVLRTCLLPQSMTGRRGVFDFSGLGGEPGAVLPDDVLGVASAGTTRMRLVRERGVCTGAENRPGVDPADHVEDVVAGFGQAYASIARHRAALDPLLAGFRDVAVRVIVRHTRHYAQLLDESTHPDVLRDAVARDRLFDHLRTGAEHEELVEHERADLWAGDVPLFTTTPASRDLVTSAGARVPDVLAEPGADRVARKIAGMGAADLRTQEWVIRAAFASRAGVGRAEVDRGRPRGPRLQHAGRTGRLLAAARSIGDELLATAHDDGTRVNWLGLVRTGERWEVRPLPPTLPDGALGVALFLAQLADVTGAAEYAEPVPRVVAAVRTTSPPSAGPPSIGAAGLGGIAYALARLNAGGVAHWVDLAAAGVDAAPPDFLDGTAGCLAAMRAVHRLTGLATAEACVRRLRHVPVDFAWCDRPRDASDDSLCHGALADGEPDPERVDRLLASIERDGPRCATPGRVRTPGLVDGLAGIGHGLLRLAVPGRVPSVLRFE
jgi:type 2 lantibiotic biosynthesis protein LanM